MVSSAAKTVPHYLAELPPERRDVVAALRKLIVANLPPGYEEGMNWGMLCYQIPLARYPDTYNGQPLGCVALAAQKNAYSLYLCTYMFGEGRIQKFRAAWAATGKKLDMGKCCVRFKKVDDLALDVIAAEIASIGVDDYIRQYEKVRAETAVGIRPVKAKSASRKAVSSSRSKPAGRRETKVVAKKAAPRKRK